MGEERYWPSQTIFILAAIGSAAGLGNLWRFPFLAFEHGGGAFVVALLFANIVIGIPLLALEVGLGQMAQKGAPDAFGRIKKNFRYLGWLALVFGFMVLSYYMAVVGWGIDYFASSFNLTWGSDPESYFFNNILNISDGVGAIGGISWPALSGLIMAWAVVYFSVWKGIRSISKVVLWSATLPFVILAVLIARALTLDGAIDGLKLFLLPQWQSLLNSKLWLDAFSQVFFSLSLVFGIMVAYGSLKKPDSEITKSVIWVMCGNFLVSLMSGVVVFGTLGYMALQQNVAITEVLTGGPALAFVVFPQAISLLPAFNTIVGILFFGMLLALAVDSAFSLLEAISVAFRDRYPHISTQKTTLMISIVGFIFGIVFVTHAGLYFLDIVDHFVVNYGLVVVGMLEAIAVGWFWKGDGLIEYINSVSKIKLGNKWNLSIKFITPIFLGFLLVWNIVNEFKTPYEGYPVWAIIYIGVIPIIISPIIAFVSDRLTNKEEI